MLLIKNSDIKEMFNNEEEEYVLYFIETGKVKMLNEVGAYIWNQIPEKKEFDKDKTIQNIVEDLKDIHPSVIELFNDISAYIGDLVKEGALLDGEKSKQTA